MLNSAQPRIVGVDYGTKRVGMALADPLRMFAQPHGSYPPGDVLSMLQRLHRDEGIATIVVGWPLTLDGEEGEATATVQEFIDQVKEVLPAVEIVKRDERFTSEMAKDAIRRFGGKHARIRDKGRIDAAAAALILQDYLDAA